MFFFFFSEKFALVCDYEWILRYSKPTMIQHKKIYCSFRFGHIFIASLFMRCQEKRWKSTNFRFCLFNKYLASFNLCRRQLLFKISFSLSHVLFFCFSMTWQFSIPFSTMRTNVSFRVNQFSCHNRNHFTLLKRKFVVNFFYFFTPYGMKNCLWII